MASEAIEPIRVFLNVDIFDLPYLDFIRVQASNIELLTLIYERRLPSTIVAKALDLKTLEGRRGQMAATKQR
jgi:hypothetical protein